MRPLRWHRRRGKKTTRHQRSGKIGVNRNFVRIRELLQIRSETCRRAVCLLHADENAAARLATRSTTHTSHPRYGTAGKKPADVNHFVGFHRAQNALKATSARPLLNDEGNRECASHL